MTTPTTEQLLGGGGRSAKFEAPGDTIEGTVIAKDVNQQTDFKTGEKLYYPKSGDPMWQIIATVQTNMREDADDDGLRKIYFKSGLMKALREELKVQNLKDIEVGGWIKVIHTGLGVAEGGGNAPKLYVVDYRSKSAQVIGGPAAQQDPYASAVANVQAGLGGQPVPNYQQNVAQPQYAPQQAAPQQGYFQGGAQPNVQIPQQAPPQASPQAAPQAGAVQPTPAQIQAVLSAGLNPADVYPGYQPPAQG